MGEANDIDKSKSKTDPPAGGTTSPTTQQKHGDISQSVSRTSSVSGRISSTVSVSSASNRPSITSLSPAGRAIPLGGCLYGALTSVSQPFSDAPTSPIGSSPRPDLEQDKSESESESGSGSKGNSPLPVRGGRPCPARRGTRSNRGIVKNRISIINFASPPPRASGIPSAPDGGQISLSSCLVEEHSDPNRGSPIPRIPLGKRRSMVMGGRRRVQPQRRIVRAPQRKIVRAPQRSVSFVGHSISAPPPPVPTFRRRPSADSSVCPSPRFPAPQCSAPPPTVLARR